MDTSSPSVYFPAFFAFPHLAERTRILESPYNLFFGKLVLRSLFDDYFEQADNRFGVKVMLKPTDWDGEIDGFDFIATFDSPLDHNREEGIAGNTQFRLKSDFKEIEVCNDICFSSPGSNCLMKSSAYFPELGFGATCILPILSKSRFLVDPAVLGLRWDYSSHVSNLSVGTTFDTGVGEYPSTAWLLSRFGRLTAGVQYEPKFGSKAAGRAPLEDLANWSYAISIGSGSSSLLTPSIKFGLELANNSRFIASFYKHMVILKRLRTLIESANGDTARWVYNYIDFGLELQTRVNDGKLSKKIKDLAFQVAASWQFNNDLLLKGKVGLLSSSIALAYKRWWIPSFTFNASVTKDHTNGQSSFGFGIQIDNIRKKSFKGKIQI